ncbi:TerB family tellurite resistance protein [Neotabrizicola shimadae]|uniref:TerB family tellurite resistance protein n=1 Tax=Neotabrizicola shimadae TaxID=2807096 RepID=A0A8G0ZYE6_9RHOB|nr:TerB family tellurite resistance protein [Neotabrizicola shimadae]QYZ71123.1 TerB family tellurite resistance protein [Neotabrizicola shimadae]
MSIWSRISAALAALAQGEPLSVVFDRLRGDPEVSVGFTIAVIALGAKLAKADGEVTRDEVACFRRIFTIPPDEEANAARVYNLARQDVAGFEFYARKIGKLFKGGHETLLPDLMEGLFRVAVADGHYNDAEDAFLHQVAREFGMDDRAFRAVRARCVEGVPRDPYDVLGVTHDTDLDDIRAAWKRAVRENHPDALIARGLPPEAAKLAEARMVAINRAWEEIESERSPRMLPA